jgi:hypothetical protein
MMRFLYVIDLLKTIYRSAQWRDFRTDERSVELPSTRTQTWDRGYRLPDVRERVGRDSLKADLLPTSRRQTINSIGRSGTAVPQRLPRPNCCRHFTTATKPPQAMGKSSQKNSTGFLKPLGAFFCLAQVAANSRRRYGRRDANERHRSRN